MPKFKDAQDVLDNYYKQDALIGKDGVKIINPEYKALVDFVEEFGQQKYDEGYDSCQSEY